MAVWVCGEALIDMLPAGPVPGGGAANTAIALARLGVDTHFIGGLSTDDYGTRLRQYLTENGVDVSKALTSSRPTALAIVSLDARGSAHYEFRLEDTATFTIDGSLLPIDAPQLLHIGSLAAIVEPAASAFYFWAADLRVPIIYDPNVRPAVISDVDVYRASVERWAGIATVVKLSEDDLAFLYPGVDREQALTRIMKPGVQLVLLTRGADGLLAATRDRTIAVTGQVVDVVDTVGAGDTVGAVIAEALVTNPDIALTDADLEYVLERAVRAAAITCSRAGCQPPFAHELV